MKAFILPYGDNGSMDVTITLDDELVRKAEKIAAERGTSVAAVMRNAVEEIVAEDARNHAYQEDIRRSLALPKVTFSGPLPSRQERNERAGLPGL